MISTGKKRDKKARGKSVFQVVLLFFAVLLFSGGFLPTYFSSLDAEVVELIQFDDNENEKEKEKEKEEDKSKFIDFYFQYRSYLYLDTPLYLGTKVPFWNIPLQDVITPPPERA